MSYKSHDLEIFVESIKFIGLKVWIETIFNIFSRNFREYDHLNKITF